jgi:hypothetical protein
LFKPKTGRASFKYLNFKIPTIFNRPRVALNSCFEHFRKPEKSVVTEKYLQLFYDTVLKRLIELIKREEAKAILRVF